MDYVGGDFLRIISACVSDMKLKRKECLASFVKERERWKLQYIVPRIISWEKIQHKKEDGQKEEENIIQINQTGIKDDLLGLGDLQNDLEETVKHIEVVKQQANTKEKPSEEFDLLGLCIDNNPIEEEKETDCTKPNSNQSTFLSDSTGELEYKMNEVGLDTQLTKDGFPIKEIGSPLTDLRIISNDVKQLIPLLTSKIKIELFQSNPIFQKMKFREEKFRLSLPLEDYKQEKINFWKILQDGLGKDLSKFTLPVHFNEPLSLLQTTCEQFEYAELLDKANNEKDPCLRMAYVMAFVFSGYSSTLNRVRKPFNPLLGETYTLQYKDKMKKFNFIAEQVSHHPPISAYHCENENYKASGDIQLKMTFWGKSLEFTPKGSHSIYLKNFDETYTYNRANSTIENILIGSVYIDQSGDMNFINHKLGYQGKLKMKKRGWIGLNAFKGQGEIKTPDNKIVYEIFGKWNSQLSATNVETNNEIQLWKICEKEEDNEKQFAFTNFSKQLNYLTKALVVSLPPTDSRFRPDQTALEQGKVDEAQKLKDMLENSQRRRKKVRTAEKQVYQPLWFDLEKLQEGDDSDVKVSFNQKYWGKKEYEVNYPTLYT